MINWLLKLLSKKPSVPQTSRFVAETELTYIRSENLNLGMYVAKLDCPWLDSPFKLQGFNLTTERELEAIRRRCHHVYIDLTRQSKLSLNAKSSTVGKTLVIGKAEKKRGSFEKEITRAVNVYQDTGDL